MKRLIRSSQSRASESKSQIADRPLQLRVIIFTRVASLRLSAMIRRCNQPRRRWCCCAIQVVQPVPFHISYELLMLRRDGSARCARLPKRLRRNAGKLARRIVELDINPRDIRLISKPRHLYSQIPVQFRSVDVQRWPDSGRHAGSRNLCANGTTPCVAANRAKNTCFPNEVRLAADEHETRIERRAPRVASPFSKTSIRISPSDNTTAWKHSVTP